MGNENSPLAVNLSTVLSGYDFSSDDSPPPKLSLSPDHLSCCHQALKISNPNSISREFANLQAGFFGSAPDTGRGKSKMWKNITYVFHFVKGKSSHPMKHYVVSEFKKVDCNELGLFEIFNGHVGYDVAKYLKTNLFEKNILKEKEFWTDTKKAIKKRLSRKLGKRGSTAVTGILLNGWKLVVSDAGDSRAADVPRVDGQLAVARAFGDMSLKLHLSSEPDITHQAIDDQIEFSTNSSPTLTSSYHSCFQHILRSIREAGCICKAQIVEVYNKMDGRFYPALDAAGN
ncbi:unnamed protein product [Eruca vesicaria subsp. sativa]|uniref:PPM-type phosphatase domain-containing protein n=1 Tax=Eruca vesicaria subsp. sativa TaxID=29727 RepID=A0ABC8IPK2_ERUVS|nr:unnamed protein product [Eruca vesicaria subsp. sativa]